MKSEGFAQWIPSEQRKPESGERVLLAIACVDTDSEIFDHIYQVGYYASAHTIEVCEESCGFNEILCSEYDDEVDKSFLLEGWYACLVDIPIIDSVEVSDPVTHWMPFPKIPEVVNHG